MNPKDSFVVALFGPPYPCIPGILSNLNKYRQIQCQYINCLQDSINTGLPADACEKVKSYETCKYFVGEIFQVVPFTAMYQWFMDMLKSAVSDPFQVIGIGLSLACRNACKTKPSSVHAICYWSKVLAMIGEVLNDINTIIDKDAWKLSGDYCSQLETPTNE